MEALATDTETSAAKAEALATNTEAPEAKAEALASDTEVLAAHTEVLATNAEAITAIRSAIIIVYHNYSGNNGILYCCIFYSIGELR